MELSQVQQLQQSFDPTSGTASLTWSYDQKGPIEFEVSLMEGGNVVNQSSTNKTSITLNGLELGKVYTATVTPILKKSGKW